MAENDKSSSAAPRQDLQTETKQPKKQSPKRGNTKAKILCGIIMPISEIDSCPKHHWSDVREILEDAVEDAGFEPRLVSDADEVGIIHKRIIQNIYNDPIVVCDVSAKNPNVMFELGMRLAFDKPTIIVKDDKTAFSFDTGLIEHLEYPRDLRFAKIVEFQEVLTTKIAATHKAAQSDKNFSTFLKNFGTFTVPKLDTKSLNLDDFILDELRTLKSLIVRQSPRDLDQLNQSLLFSDASKGHSADVKKFLNESVERALRRTSIRKSPPNDRTNEIIRWIEHHDQPGKYFRSRAEFESALRAHLVQRGFPIS